MRSNSVLSIPPKPKVMRIILLAFFAAISVAGSAQEVEESNTLNNQYKELKSKSNNYQIYKVVKETSLDEFWSSVQDTIRNERTQVQSLQKELSSSKKEVNDLNAQVAQRDASIEEQEYNIEHMSFLGIPLTKGTYVTFTWILIFMLFFAAMILYFRFIGANKTTTQTKKEMESLQNEFEGHRQRTRENETKLKRDLQTELNRVEELKAQLDGDA